MLGKIKTSFLSHAISIFYGHDFVRPLENLHDLSAFQPESQQMQAMGPETPSSEF